jgi:DNA-binding CsgD family transcriptional regulator
MLTKTRPTHYNTRYKHDLSPRQREVLDLIARGKTNAEIATRLGISLDGAKWHVREILGKLDLESREEAAFYWQRYNAPMARLGRAMSALTFGGSTLKAALAVTASVAVIAVAAAAVIAISNARGDGTSGAGPDDRDVVATPSPIAPVNCPVNSAACEVALQLQPVVEGRDLDTLVSLMSSEDHVCPGGAPQGAGGPFPLCTGASAGEVRTGYLIFTHLSQGLVVSAEQLKAEFDRDLSGAFELSSIGCKTGDADCSEFLVAFSRVDAAQPPAYPFFYLAAELDAGIAQLVALGRGYDMATEVAQGGVGEITFLRGGPSGPSTTFVPYTGE